ncbi:hypothetical protein Leryth_024733 [Lithospermum erythrorhizon]|nr:hypothetical protein Leryth_024733 [Lithospermum erythrorhizon]
MQGISTFWTSTPPLRPTKPRNSKAKAYKYETMNEFLRSSMPNNAFSAGKSIPLPSHVKTITSTANPFVKHCLKLRENSSYRHRHGCVLVVGSTPIRTFLLGFSVEIRNGLSLDVTGC